MEGDAPAPATTGRGRGRGRGAGRGNGAALQHPAHCMPTSRGRRKGTSWQRDASAGPESLESSEGEPLEGHDVAPTARMQQQLQQEMQQQVQQQVQQALVQQGLEPQRKTSKSSKRKKGESSSEAASETASDADSSDDELGLHRERAKKLVPELAAAAAAGKPGLLNMYHDLLHLTTLLYAHKASSNSQRLWNAIKQEILQQSKIIEVASKHGWDAARAALEPSKGGAHAVLSLSKKERKRLAAFLKEDKQHKRATANSGLGKLPYTGHPPKPKDGCWDCGGDHRQADCPRRGRSLPGPPPR